MNIRNMLRETSVARRRQSDDRRPIQGKPLHPITVNVVKGLAAKHAEIGAFVAKHRNQNADATLAKKLAAWLKETTGSDYAVLPLDNFTLGVKLRVSKTVVPAVKADTVPPGKEP